jgi:adenylate cyclase
MSIKLSRRLPLGIRLAGVITLLAIGAMSLLSLAILGKQSQLQSEQLQDLGNALVAQMASSVTEAVFTGDETTIQVQVQQFSEMPRIRALAVSDKERLLASAGDLVQLNALVDSAYYFRSEIRFKDVVGGEVIMLLEADQLVASYGNMLRLVLLATGVVSVLALLMAYVISRRISEPINELLSVTTRIGTGAGVEKVAIENKLKTGERRNDELGQLIEAVNQMGHGLYQKKQLEERLAGFVNKDVARKVVSELDQVQLGGERVSASVMFADIAGFTAMSEQMTPEQVADLLNEYFNYFTLCSRHFFGTIDKFIGDCVMVLFGAPKEDPHHHFHAVACAVLMIKLTEELNRQRLQKGLPIVSLRIGVNSGEMVAGVLGTADKMEYSVVGDAVNLASRLCGEAQASDIVISEEVYRNLHAPDLVVVEKLQVIQVRGKRESVEVYRVKDVAAKQKASINSVIDDILNSKGVS